MLLLWFILIVNVRPLSVGLDLFFILIRIILWLSAGKELSPWLFTCVVFIFSAVLVVCVPFLFGIWDRVWNSIVSVPDHCLFIYFTWNFNALSRPFRVGGTCSVVPHENMALFPCSPKQNLDFLCSLFPKIACVPLFPLFLGLCFPVPMKKKMALFPCPPKPLGGPH